MSRRPPTTQRGFSLIELMVAMAVSLVLMLGIVQILLGNKDSYRTQNELAVLHQNARLARFVLDNAVAHAGYLADLDADRAYTFEDGFIAEDDGETTDALDVSDSLTVLYQSDGAMSNCLGHVVDEDDETASEENDEDQLVHLALRIDEANNELECATYNDISGAIKNAEPLINNVVLMKLRFGLDSDPDDNRNSVDAYTNSLAADQKDQVRSVRVQLVLKSDTELRSTPHPGFDIAGYSNEFEPADKYHAYVMVDKVIALRNLLP